MSSEYQDRLRMCSGKRKFPNHRVAEKVAREMRERDDDSPLHLTPYKCLFCRSWHVGHGTDIKHEEYAEDARTRRISRPRTAPPEIEDEQ